MAVFGGNRYMVPFNGGIATPVCALARNDSISKRTSVNNNLSFLPCPAAAASRVTVKRLRRYAYSVMGTPMIDALG